jgi:hypothetical protein
MNEFRDMLKPDANDPLERLIEAFVGQSAPEGPDESTQRRLVAALRATDAASERREAAPRTKTEPRGAGSRRRRWVFEGGRRLLALAAAILVVIGAALAWQSPQQVAEAPVRETPAVAVTTTDLTTPPEPTTAAERRLSEDLAQLAESYLREHGGRLPDRDAVKDMLATLLREHPELATSKTWQFAHERLTYALERPQVLTLGVGLLGTLPWTAYGRF